jgi:hypothetical protein
MVLALVVILVAAFRRSITRRFVAISGTTVRAERH